MARNPAARNTQIGKAVSFPTRKPCVGPIWSRSVSYVEMQIQEFLRYIILIKIGRIMILQTLCGSAITVTF